MQPRCSGRHGAAGVTALQGFRATGVTAGLGASGRPDVALVVNDGPAFDAAAVSRRIASGAAIPCDLVPVMSWPTGAWTRWSSSTSAGHACALAVRGFQDAPHCRLVAEGVRLRAPATSRSVRQAWIGELPPMDKIADRVDACRRGAHRRGRTGCHDRHRGRRNTVAQRVAGCLGDGWGVGHGKGCGHTRAGASRHARRRHHGCRCRRSRSDAVLRAATATTFDRIDSDGCMSTNDTVPVDGVWCRGRHSRRPTTPTAAGHRGL